MITTTVVGWCRISIKRSNESQQTWPWSQVRFQNVQDPMVSKYVKEIAYYFNSNMSSYVPTYHDYVSCNNRRAK